MEFIFNIIFFFTNITETNYTLLYFVLDIICWVIIEKGKSFLLNYDQVFVLLTNVTLQNVDDLLSDIIIAAVCVKVCA